MFNGCLECGAYRVDKIIDPEGPFAICPECGSKQRFVQLPLLIISGASGVGKSTALRLLLGQIHEVVLLDSDILWRAEFKKPEIKYRDYFELWLRMCKDISQSGRPVALCGAGMGVPENIEPCVERRYLSTLHYLGLTCQDEVLVARLTGRSKTASDHDPAFIQAQVKFNHWFKEHGRDAQPAVETLDTTHMEPEETAQSVAAWIRGKLALTNKSAGMPAPHP